MKQRHYFQKMRIQGGRRMKKIMNILKKDKSRFTEVELNRQLKICYRLVVIGGLLTIGAMITAMTTIIGGVILSFIMGGCTGLFLEEIEDIHEEKEKREEEENYNKILEKIKKKNFSEILLVDEDLKDLLFQDALEKGYLKIKYLGGNYIAIEIEKKVFLKEGASILETFELGDHQ